jgi:hypothetical protein
MKWIESTSSAQRGRPSLGGAAHLLGWHKPNLEPVLHSRPKPVEVKAIE